MWDFNVSIFIYFEFISLNNCSCFVKIESRILAYYRSRDATNSSGFAPACVVRHQQHLWNDDFRLLALTALGELLFTVVTATVRSSRVSSAVKSPTSQRAKSAGFRQLPRYPRCMTAGPSEMASRHQVSENTKKIQRPKSVSKHYHSSLGCSPWSSLNWISYKT